MKITPINPIVKILNDLKKEKDLPQQKKKKSTSKTQISLRALSQSILNKDDTEIVDDAVSPEEALKFYLGLFNEARQHYKIKNLFHVEVWGGSDYNLKGKSNQYIYDHLKKHFKIEEEDINNDCDLVLYVSTDIGVVIIHRADDSYAGLNLQAPIMILPDLSDPDEWQYQVGKKLLYLYKETLDDMNKKIKEIFK